MGLITKRRVFLFTIIVSLFVMTVVVYINNNWTKLNAFVEEADHFFVKVPRFALSFPLQNEGNSLDKEKRDNFSIKVDDPVKPSRDYKKILYWNEAYGDRSFFFGLGTDAFRKAGCRVQTCYASHNRSLWRPHEVDALIWHFRSNDKSLPATRRPHTYYVFWVMESAFYTYADVSQYNGIFNWTMTYRLDSDFPIPTGLVIRTGTKPAQTELSRNYAAGKTKLAAWFVSHCKPQSMRERLVEAMKKLMPVDVYGDCGSLRCPRSRADECYDMLERDYKFYFSFENSLCTDYITEKLYSVLSRNVVPVVYGLGYSKQGLVEHSYIDAMNFKTVKQLVDYLLYLNANDTAYNEYFRWKEEGYKIIPDQDIKRKAFCDLCEKLHEVTVPSGSPPSNSFQPRKSPEQEMRFINSKQDTRNKSTFGYRQIYMDLKNWFTKDQCVQPLTLDIIKDAT